MAKAKVISELQVKLSIVSNKLKEGAKQAGDAIDKLKSKTNGLKSSFSGISGALSSMGAKLIDFINPIGLIKAGLLAISAAIVGIIAVGSKMCGIFNDIQVNTGALGNSLNDLQTSLTYLIGTVSSDAGQLGNALSKVNGYLGLTGKDLEKLTTLFSKYADITHKDVGPATEMVSKAFNLWDVKSENMEKTLNVLFGISQATCMSLEGISQAVITGASFMKRFGYSIEEAAAELGSFEKFGISSSTVIIGMKMAVSKMVEKGITPSKAAWNDLKKSIVNAKTDTEALTIATEYFGHRVAADMVDAIKLSNKALNGLNKDFDKLGTSLQDSIDLQEGSFRNTLNLTKNRIELVGKSIFDKIKPALQTFAEEDGKLVEKLEPLWKLLDHLADKLIPLICDGIVLVANVIGWLWDNILKPFVEWLDEVISNFSFEDFFKGIENGVKAITGVFSGLGSLWDDATKSMNNYYDNLDKKIDETSNISFPNQANTSSNYTNNTSTKNNNVIYNNNINIKGTGYSKEELNRALAHTESLKAIQTSIS